MYRYDRESTLGTIARKHLDVKSLRPTGNDMADKRVVMVWDLKDALNEAYKAGFKDGKKDSK
jgi:hypothetical protein